MESHRVEKGLAYSWTLFLKTESDSQQPLLHGASRERLSGGSIDTCPHSLPQFMSSTLVSASLILPSTPTEDPQGLIRALFQAAVVSLVLPSHLGVTICPEPLDSPFQFTHPHISEEPGQEGHGAEVHKHVLEECDHSS